MPVYVVASCLANWRAPSDSPSFVHIVMVTGSVVHAAADGAADGSADGSADGAVVAPLEHAAATMARAPTSAAKRNGVFIVSRSLLADCL
jgi:hypothetical protein